ncbi:MAG: DNA polymerase III subunit chi [Methylovulum sp.]|nr:DNA polymerase III subunit chi [Methylovulum sp.]
MTTVSFYLLPSDAAQQRHQFACKLIEKSYRSGCFCYVLTDTAEQSRFIDDLLWTFRAGSFVPHQLYTGELPAIETVILIGSRNPPGHWQKNVINLSSQCPENFQQAERILEILDDSEDTKAAGRQRYRQYKEAGIAVATHKINPGIGDDN